MRHSRPAEAGDPNGRPLSGTAVVAGLVLLVLAGAGIAVVLFLSLGRVSFLHRVAAERAAESQADQRGTPKSGGPRRGETSEGEALSPGAAEVGPTTPSESYEHAARTATKPPPEAVPAPTTDQGAKAMSPPRPKLEESIVRILDLAPIEIAGTDANVDTWRRPMRIGGRVYDQVVSARPTEDQGTSQIAFAIQGRFARLSGFAAIADLESNAAAGAEQSQPQAEFRVYGDGNLLWQSEPLLGPGKRQTFQCDVRGIDVLTLVSESLSPACISNLAWGDLQLDNAGSK